MKFDEAGNAWTSESHLDFKNCNILLVEDFKPGIKRVHVRFMNSNGKPEFRLIYASVAHLNGLVLPDEHQRLES